jgi:hypothetical protein
MLPTGTPSRATPSRTSVTWDESFSAGIRLASVPCTVPSRTNTVAVADLARRVSDSCERIASLKLCSVWDIRPA